MDNKTADKSSKLSFGVRVLEEERNYFRVLKTFQKSQSLMANLSLATVANNGEVLVSFTHPQDMLHEVIISNPEHMAIWLNKAGDDFCVIPCVGGMVFMCSPFSCNGENAGYILAGPVWENPPNREQRQELANLFNWNDAQLREAIISHPATIPLDLSSSREVTICLAELTTQLLQLYSAQYNNLNTFRRLYEISTRLGSSLDLDNIINVVIDGAMSLVKCSGCSLGLIDDTKDTVDINFRDIADKTLTQVNRIHLNGMMENYVAKYSQPYVTNEDGISSITLPLHIEGKVRGYIEIVSDTDSNYTYSNDDVELLQIISSHASSAIEKSLVYTRALRQFRELEVLQSVGLSLNSSSSLPQTLSQILDHTCTLLNAKTASVMLLEPDRQTLRIRVARGLPNDVIRSTKVRVGERLSGQVALSGEPAMIRRDNSSQDTSSALCVPLKANNKIIGVLNVRSFPASDPFSTADLNLATRLASMSAAAIETAELHDELQQLFLESITALANSIDARDSYTRGHSERVADYSLLIGKYLNFTKAEMWKLRNAALLHDIGKIKIPDSLLNKPGKLTDEEYAEMKLHPVYGAGIMHPVKSFSSMVPYILHHHERYDGSGYPDHKAGDEIPFYARIIAVADAFDAMTSTRPYRRCMDPEIAMDRLVAAKGTQLDPYLVNIFEILYKQGQIAPIVDKARTVEGIQDSRSRIQASSTGVVFFNSNKLLGRIKIDEPSAPNIEDKETARIAHEMAAQGRAAIEKAAQERLAKKEAKRKAEHEKAEAENDSPTKTQAEKEPSAEPQAENDSHTKTQAENEPSAEPQAEKESPAELQAEGKPSTKRKTKRGSSAKRKAKRA